MFSNLYLLSYNNYLNRTLKYLDNIEEYAEYDSIVFSNINFNPNDEVTTEQILNVGDYDTFDYLIVQSQETGKIASRWFVIDKTRIRSGQWKLTLRRDVVVDYWNVIKSAPCFIEKASLAFEDPRIFNSEDMSFNQIKTAETLLKDRSKCAWIVGYYAKDSSIKGDDSSNVGTIATNNVLDTPFIQIDTTLDNWKFYNLTNFSSDQTPLKVYRNFIYRYNVNGSPLIDQNAGYTVDINSPAQVNVSRIGFFGVATSLTAAESYSNKTALSDEFKKVITESQINSLNSMASTYMGSQDILANELLTYHGKTIRTIDGKVYNVRVKETYTTETQTNLEINSNLFLSMKQISDQVKNNGAITGNPNDKSFVLINSNYNYTIELEELIAEELTYDMATSTKLITTDAPYNIFAIPYGEIDIYDDYSQEGEVNLCKTNAEIAINAAMAIQKNNPGIVYDIQILPYCPVQGLIIDGKIYFTSAEQYSTIKKGEEIKGVIINVPSSRFEFNIINAIPAANSAIERKVNNQCDKWRLASPNYNTYFDFSVEMNNGVDYFNVDCEYKPYSPYIHINPNFKGLYGQDFNDPRGLVCGGDYSIAAVIDQWQQYQIQNKNFQNIFDRQIENMNVVNSVQREKEIWGVVAGTLQGATSGAMTGAMAGGGWGALAGGLAGAAGSALTGAADIRLNERLRNEALDLTKDNFGYQLGNIQALPNTLSRISAFNNNNKLFPVLEYYTCTEVEKEALRNKIKYNGMTVMTIGSLEDYVTDSDYIKGKIIKLPLIKDDFHVANTIVYEINQGLYIQGGL